MNKYFDKTLSFTKTIFYNLKKSILYITIFLLFSSNIYVIISINDIKKEIEYLDERIGRVEAENSNIDDRIDDVEDKNSSLEYDQEQKQQQIEDNENRINELEDQVNE